MSKTAKQWNKLTVNHLFTKLTRWESYGHDLEMDWSTDDKIWRAKFHFVPHDNYEGEGKTLKKALVALIMELPDWSDIERKWRL
jgi:hypothetical protein